MEVPSERIQLPQQRGDDLQMHLESGVLRGGGTGPRIFRIAYDECILGWKQTNADTGQELLVEYCGHQHALGVAAFADDLIRIEAAKDLQILTERTAANTASLEAFLVPRNLRLNADKGETLLSFAGKGVYGAAREAHSGQWRGYPPKLVVKYLGARLQSNGSMQAEINRRIASAKAGFAKYALLFKRSHVPIAHKVLVFKAVVNEALLSAFEVRPIGRGDEEALERAREVLLRHIFGRQGYGAVFPVGSSC